jgi:hypothetical protein
MTGSVDITGSLTVNGVAISGSTTPSTTLFNFAFGTDPTNVVFTTIDNNNTRTAYQMNYQLTSGSISINAGQLQITADGTSVAVVDTILQRNISGAPTASFNAVYTGGDIDVRATFVGANYDISGSYKNLI